jgi:hypothetical protein
MARQAEKDWRARASIFGDDKVAALTAGVTATPSGDEV